MTRVFIIAAALAALTACASAPSTSAPEAAAPVAAPAGPALWSFSFDAGPGLASAKLAADGVLLADVVCQAPKGPVQIRDFRAPASAAGTAVLTVAAVSGEGAAVETIEADGRKAVRLTLPVDAPVWAALAPGAAVAFAADGKTHPWPADSAERLNDVLNACRATGS